MLKIDLEVLCTSFHSIELQSSANDAHIVDLYKQTKPDANKQQARMKCFLLPEDNLAANFPNSERAQILLSSGSLLTSCSIINSVMSGLHGICKIVLNFSILEIDGAYIRSSSSISDLNVFPLKSNISLVSLNCSKVHFIPLKLI